MGTETNRLINMGFIQYGSSDESVIEYASLADSSNVGSISLTGDVDFNNDGVRISATQTGTGVVSIPNSIAVQMVNGGHISFDMTNEIFNYSTVEANSAVIVGISGTNSCHIRKDIGSVWQLGQGGTAPDTIYLDAQGMPAKPRVVISFNNLGIDLYVDYAFVRHWDWNTTKPLFDSDITLGGLTSNFKITKSRFSNIQYSTRPINLPVSENHITDVFLGDSQTKNGQYPLLKYQLLGEQTEPYGDTSIKANTIFKNRGLLPCLHSELAKRGVYVGQRIYFYGRGSCEVLASAANALSDRTDVMLAETAGEYPSPSMRGNVQRVYCMIGTNDIAQSTDPALVIADYKTEIDRWVAAGVEDIVLINVPNRYTPAPKSDAAGLAEIAALNALINDLVNYDSTIRAVINANALITQADAGTDGIHLAATGYVKVAKAIAALY